MRIADWPKDERPRERLLRQGAGVLTESEILAIFRRTGIGGRNAIELGRDLLARFGCLPRLFAATLDEVSAVRGLGPAKHIHLQAVVEVVRRALRYCRIQPYPCSRWRTRPEKWIVYRGLRLRSIEQVQPHTTCGPICCRDALLRPSMRLSRR